MASASITWYLVKEYIAGYVTYYVVPAENSGSVIWKLENAGYYNKDANYELDEIEWKGHVAKIVEIDVW